MSLYSINFTKECCFFVSEFHLVTMLLPHINKSINEEVKVTTILEENVEEYVKILLNKINIKNKENIINIGWNNSVVNYNKIRELLNNNKNIEIIISGSNGFINNVNNMIEENLLENIRNNTQKNKIKIINCYNIANIKNIKDILDIHDHVLNTSGEKTVEEYKQNIK